ncbi:MAG: prepilin-type N-terminal cleavage/methylation domain-containing protein [Phycisphaerae bacterium]|nr:prepilin-type N-terminal cleavage/methylation domain-containing protein [Phycisphaerae bacterium]
MRLFQPGRMPGIFACRESGVTLIETVVALAILSAIAVAFLSGLGLATTSRAVFIADERTTAESLARSQMEWAKSVGYEYDATEYFPAPIPSGKDYINYSATIAATSLRPSDDGIQKIVVTIKRYDKEVFKLEGYKVDR